MIRRIRNARIRWAVMLMAAISFASHWEVAPSMPDWDFFAFDKLAHWAVYGLLSTLFVRALGDLSNRKKAFSSAFFFTVAFGLIDESIQATNPLRDFSLADLLADALGATTALTAYLAWPAYRRILECHLWGRKEVKPLA